MRQKKFPGAILCIIDANYNRAKEGFRVAEDIFRFVHNDRALMYLTKRLRHKLTAVLNKEVMCGAIVERDSPRDLGRAADPLEMERASVRDILFANLQRVKESLRVLEEFFKLIDIRQVEAFKKLRYETYELEKKIITKKHYLCRHR